ncbi:hemerythrin domain-containing protein [Sphingobacterium cellulitidis]|uniref:hemerythrin domain-containing protein n=1 Tax=Sphingobacterium cellulitidis TaxID=1768011 RepID=UPI0026CE0621
METKPLKRHPALRPLSKEHHFSLLICWKIRRGLELNIDPSRIAKYLIYSWENHLSKHFQIEEDYVFPVLSSSNKLILDAIADHKTLKRLIFTENHNIKSLNRIEEKLESHIRMEERQLFPLIQSVATDSQMEIINVKHNHPIHELPWEDEFWVSKS